MKKLFTFLMLLSVISFAVVSCDQIEPTSKENTENTGKENDQNEPNTPDEPDTPDTPDTPDEPNEPDTQDEEGPYDNLSPQNQSWALCLYYTYNTCYYCGQWGHSALESAVNVGNTVGVAIKISPDPEAIPTQLYWSFHDDRPLNGGAPTLYAGDLCKDNSAASYCRQLVNRTCSIGIDAQQEIEGNTLSLHVKTKNFTNINASDYYIVAYLLEDDLHYSQYGSSSNLHNFVLRRASSGAVYYGEQLMTDGSVDAEFTKTFSFDVSQYNKDNCYAAVVIYKKGGSGLPEYKFENCFWTRK